MVRAIRVERTLFQLSTLRLGNAAITPSKKMAPPAEFESTCSPISFLRFRKTAAYGGIQRHKKSTNQIEYSSVSTEDIRLVIIELFAMVEGNLPLDFPQFGQVNIPEHKHILSLIT